MSLQTIKHKNTTWVNVEKASSTDIEQLKTMYPFHPLALEDCLSRIERPKVDEYDNHLFIVMHFPRFDYNRRISCASEVDLFIGKGYLVTVHDGNLKPLTAFFETCRQDEAIRNRYMDRGASVLMHAVVDRLVDYMFPILYKLDSHISRIEDLIFEEDARQIVQEISIVRRDIIALRRIIRPQIAVIDNLEKQDRPFIREELDDYFGDILDHITKVRDILDDDQEVIVALSQTIDSLLSHRINEVMRILTVMSVIILPLTLVSGVYGMNVPLPFAEFEHAFTIIFGGMICILVTMLLYFRYRKWV